MRRLCPEPMVPLTHDINYVGEVGFGLTRSASARLGNAAGRT